MKLKTFIIMGFISTSCLSGCAQRPGPLGEKTIKLDDFDFSTPITDIFPDRYISTEWGEDWYQIPSPCTEYGHLYQKVTRTNYGDGNAFWITYSQQSYCDADEFLSMFGYTFSSANFAVTLDGRRIVAAGGCNHDLTQEDCDRFIALLTKRYGESEQGDGKWFPVRLYKWRLKDRTLTFAIHETDEHNILKIEKVYHEEDNTLEIREGKRRNRTEGYFFVFDGEWYDRFVRTQNMAKGDFAFTY
ncbi:MAG: hypothetical protein SOZ18_00885 [Phocaeicola sp.]|nr:hypothetical protein [Phocaeicola sp.]